MQDAYLIGTSCTRFGKQPDTSFKDLTREAYLAVLHDAGLADGDRIGHAWFGNCGMGTWGQPNVRGQVCFTPLVRERLARIAIGKRDSILDSWRREKQDAELAEAARRQQDQKACDHAPADQPVFAHRILRVGPALSTRV